MISSQLAKVVLVSCRNAKFPVSSKPESDTCQLALAASVGWIRVSPGASEPDSAKCHDHEDEALNSVSRLSEARSGHRMYWPAGHATHGLAELLSWSAWPGGQAKHAAARVEEYCPAEHVMHRVAYAEENRPAGQSLHTVAASKS